MSRSFGEESFWELWANTGGTFTDCLVRTPGGGIRRTKVLSTSALRGTAVGRDGDRSLRVDVSWDGPATLVEGFSFHPLGVALPVNVRVEAWSPESRRMLLSAPIPELPVPFSFELRSSEEAPVLGFRMIAGLGSSDPLPHLRIRLATTRGTNALLERTGSPTALFVTRGFRDILLIDDQRRPELFTLAIKRPSPLRTRVIEVDERIDSGRKVLDSLDVDAVRAAAAEAIAAGIRVAAVSLVNAYRNPDHERALERILLESGFNHVTRASAITPRIGYLDRTRTAVVNAALAPVIATFVNRVGQSLACRRQQTDDTFHLLGSTGALTRADEFRPVDSLLSGPAGGVVGAVAAGRAAGFERMITFDMGGTSTDVSRYDHGFDYVWSHSVGETKLLTPSLAVETVAAGGGSVCDYGAQGLTVGPRSAGASPGLASYGAGGPLTITDCNLLLGRIHTGNFGIPVHIAPARRALEELAGRIEQAEGTRPHPEALAGGLIEIANERMADAIRAVSIRRGYDPADYGLVVFGGAGAQHGCGVAELLGIRRIIVPRDASLLSAWGLGNARIERLVEAQLLSVLDPDLRVPLWLSESIEKLEHSARSEVAAEGIDHGRTAIIRRIANVRLLGQHATLPIDFRDPQDIPSLFTEAYGRTYGHSPDQRPLEIESVRVIAAEKESRSPGPLADDTANIDPPTAASRRSWFDGEWQFVPTIPWSDLRTGKEIDGPCLVHDLHTTVVIAPGWSGALHPTGALVLERTPVRAEIRTNELDQLPRTRAADRLSTPDAVREQIFTSRFEAIVGEMGEQLRRTALSVNVRERLDFSCALLDPRGELVANAPHIPVHLGALGMCVRAVASTFELRAGDVVATNHPAFGGSHLPDLTVITPVFSADDEHLGYVANRAHHAEIGGSTPGSMPPTATLLVEEGVVISPIRILEAGEPQWPRIESHLRTAPFPSRSPAENLADLRAQIAANQRGARMLRALAEEAGSAEVQKRMAALTRRAERGIARAIDRLGEGRWEATQELDSGARIQAVIQSTGGRLIVDFSGSSPASRGNLNATPAIVRSAVLYVLRLLIDEPLPLNEGLMRLVEIRLPSGSLLDPGFQGPVDRLPAVVGGNTEVSQRLVDTLIQALGLAACSQGTMNNVLWGTEAFGYYETIAGGEGGRPGHHGASAVHTHMTNTRITDVETLEHRFPVRVERFEIRRGSGGSGQWRGGDGVTREIRFLAPMSVSLLTQHRGVEPFAMDGGSPGARGRQWLIRRDGTFETLGSVDGAEVGAGDRLVIETPGGGGWGK